jgi:competence protein ComEC
MLSSALAFLAGICLLFSCHRLPDTAELVAVLLTAGVCLCLPRLRLAGFLLAGLVWAAWQAMQLSSMQLPAELEGRAVLVRGQVVGLPERLVEGRLRLRLHIDAYHSDGGWHPLDLPVRLNWYRQAPTIRPGEHWQLRVNLKAAHGFSNPGGFDYQRWLFAHRLRATGYISNAAVNRRLPFTPAAGVQQLRYQMSNYLQQLELPAYQRALLRALALGDRAGMSRQQWQLLQQTGTSHLLAISGLHVGLVAGLVFFLVDRLWRWLGGAQLWPSPRVGALAAMIAALLYALLAGFQVPAQRALIMIWVWMISILIGVHSRPWQVWALALSLVLLVEPLSVLSAGFWLSFSAVALILYLGRGRYGSAGRLWQLLTLQLGLVAGLTPVLWLWFQQASLIAPLANLIAIPWVGLLVVPVLLLGLLLLTVSPSLADSLIALSAWSLDWLWQLLQLLNPDLPTQWYTPPLGMLGLVLCAAGLLLLLLPRATGARGVAAALLLLVLSAEAQRPAAGDIWLTLLDVGQGLAVVVETHQHLLVYDTGPAFPSGFDTGESVLAPFLRQRGQHYLNRLVISHSDIDHSGGGRSVYRRFPVYRVDSGEPRSIAWAKASDCRHRPAWQWDGVQFEYLLTPRISSGNNASCVLKVTSADGRGVLLPGDIERSVEAALISAQAERLDASVLIAPHHGSRSSSTAEFIQAVKPDWVLFATGYRNRFGFPKAEVVARYRSAGARWMDTAVVGAISVTIEAGQAVRVEGWRKRHKRIWRH